MTDKISNQITTLIENDEDFKRFVILDKAIYELEDVIWSTLYEIEDIIQKVSKNLIADKRILFGNIDNYVYGLEEGGFGNTYYYGNHNWRLTERKLL